jgi:hypothetical protein
MVILLQFGIGMNGADSRHVQHLILTRNAAQAGSPTARNTSALTSSLRGAKRRGNPVRIHGRWIASFLAMTARGRTLRRWWRGAAA